MAVKTESMHAGEFLLSEAEGNLSRENVLVTVPATTTILAGAVLAYSGGKYVPATKALVDADADISILYRELQNDDDDPADQEGVVIDCVAEVDGNLLDWNAMAAADQDTAITALRAKAVKVRNYTPTGS